MEVKNSRTSSLISAKYNPSNSKRISPTDILFIYMNGGTVSPAIMRYITQLLDVLNEKQIKTLAHKNTSYRILKYAQEVQKYVRENI